MLVIDHGAGLCAAPDPQRPPALMARGQITTNFASLCAGLRVLVPSPPARWELATPGGQAALLPDTGNRWRILADSDDVLPWIYHAVTGGTAGFPTGARGYLTDSTVESFTSAYVDYLFLRGRAEHVLLRSRDPREDGYPRHRRRADQLTHAAIAVQDLLLDYQWSQASTAERAAWVAMPRPVPDASRSELALWRETGRWLYQPTSTDLVEHSGSPDLPAALQDAAAQKARHRSRLVQANPLLDIGVFDDHVATLRALAAARLPGLDLLTLPGR